MKLIAQIAAGLTFASALSAGAATIDFTDPGAYVIAADGVTATGTAGGVGFTITAFGGKLNNRETGPGALAGTPLSGIRDGIGIGDDEITFGKERLRLEFARDVTLTDLFAFDMFRQSADSAVGEGVTVNGGSPFFAQSGPADDPFGLARFGGLSLTGRSFTFDAVASNDTLGSPDFALAGVSFSPAVVPLPAGALLLGTGLGAFAIRRRRSAKTSA